MPAPPPYGMSSTVRWRSAAQSRRSWDPSSSFPPARRAPTLGVPLERDDGFGGGAADGRDRQRSEAVALEDRADMEAVGDVAAGIDAHLATDAVRRLDDADDEAVGVFNGANRSRG